jgi:subtilisin family serine protease
MTKKILSIRIIKITILLCIFLLLNSQNSLYATERIPYIEGEMLIKFKTPKQQDFTKHLQIAKAMNLDILEYYPINDIYLVKAKDREPLQNVLKNIKTFPEVEHVEPNYIRYKMAVTPNDPLFGQQWALQNIQMPEAWGVERGERNVVIAIADSGIDYMHEDLKNNLWRNTGEVCNNGIDDDMDGYIDNCFGINAITGSGDPMDDEGHGTHVSGIAGAKGNNSIGISGVNWKVSLMALKFIGAEGTGTVADLIETIEFAMQKGVRVFNMSFGSYDYSVFERQAIENAGNVLFMASAGNEKINNDVHPLYPASYDLPNIISVAASDEEDKLLFFSNYGKNTVHVAAPGLSILSTLPGNTYNTLTGTSMATSFVSGLSGLILSKNPTISVSRLKDQILRTVDVDSNLQGKILTGGRINAYRALTEMVSGPYIYGISPERGPIGSEVTIRGSNFKTSPGTVIFSQNLNAPVVSWSNEKIIVKVPEGAITGPVRVMTSEGMSNEVNFEVTPYPTMVKLAFPHATTEKGQVPLLIISNPLDQPVAIYTLIVGINSGERTLKVITLNSFEKRIWDLRNFGMTNDSMFIECESQGFFGAAVLSISEDLNKILAMPPIIGGPLQLIGGGTPR